MFQIPHGSRVSPPENLPQELILVESDPARLISIIHSLLDKSKTLIQSLQRALSKLQAYETEATFWKDRYYKFKRNCEIYAAADTYFLQSFEPKDELRVLRQQNESLRLQVESLRHRASRISPKFGNAADVRYFTSNDPTLSLNLHNSLHNKESLESTERFSRHREEKMGPKHISRFKFSGKKRNVSSFGEHQ